MPGAWIARGIILRDLNLTTSLRQDQILLGQPGRETLDLHLQPLEPRTLGHLELRITKDDHIEKPLLCCSSGQATHVIAVLEKQALERLLSYIPNGVS